ncbi:protein CLMP1 [Punica granatum]|uniref:PB1 domain-containing protein n=2 Tax=Punica granatum TaxID=22663 RepID=A0A218XKT1_PUNGR|nr:protein CLMP1 [Punica granatum]OWM85587.1 hypothetical protein CDL15_Pgr029010 [Punica granatum]PKI57359.1 hypothetical protein CRG98_022204 [Punica granatum]
MGKSGARKKKGGSGSNSNHVSGDNSNNSVINSAPTANGGVVDLDSTVFLKRAHELKEEGNKRFQNKDYAGALEQYDKALRLTSKSHPDRAVYHSNRAACLMQMKPIDYETVISECTLALQVQPRFVRALLRRARAFEAVGKPEMAMQDVQVLLGAEPNNQDGLEIARRLRMLLGSPHQGAQQDLQSRPSPAALGASAVRAGAPVGGIGPCLPSRPVPKKGPAVASSPGPVNNKGEKLPQQSLVPESNPETKTQMPKVSLKPLSSSSSKALSNPSSGDHKKDGMNSLNASVGSNGQSREVSVQCRPLKLIYDHDIRLSQMPVNCSFKALREIVGKRFPSSKSVLIKYKDSDGDLVTITCTSELRLAELSVDNNLGPPKDPDSDKPDCLGMLRLHVVEVSPEQEPRLLEEEEEEVKPVDTEESKGEEGVSHNSNVEGDEEREKEVLKDLKSGDLSEDHPDCKEVEMDDWLFEFAQLFRTHVGIDPDAHIDLHELGMELCTEALEETVTSEDAQRLFERAATKFQEVAALAFFNWGNVHMCAARKRVPLDESGGKDKVVVDAQLQAAYDWVKEKYSLAREKYGEALAIKPDFYEGLLALGQQQFEMAKLHWSFALARKTDISGWDPTETIQLFDSAEEKMRAATEMWEKLEEQRALEAKDPDAASKKEEALMMKRRKKLGSSGEAEQSNVGEVSPEDAAEQAAVMRSQIHLFWGNMLFERSQVECKLGLRGWKDHLDSAVERFKLAGASEADISAVLKNHCSNGDSAEGSEDGKKAKDHVEAGEKEAANRAPGSSSEQ